MHFDIHWDSRTECTVVYFSIHWALCYIQWNSKQYINKYDESDIKFYDTSTISTDTMQLFIWTRYGVLSNKLYSKLNRKIKSWASLVVFSRGKAERNYDHIRRHWREVQVSRILRRRSRWLIWPNKVRRRSAASRWYFLEKKPTENIAKRAPV